VKVFPQHQKLVATRTAVRKNSESAQIQQPPDKKETYVDEYEEASRISFEIFRDILSRFFRVFPLLDFLADLDRFLPLELFDAAELALFELGFDAEELNFDCFLTRPRYSSMFLRDFARSLPRLRGGCDPTASDAFKFVLSKDATASN
jgi:hypothetical protein